MNVISETLTLLGSLPKGTSGTVVSFDENQPEMVDRLREMGFAEGLHVELLHKSPFGGDPIAIRVGSMTVALRREQANLIKVQIV